MISGSLREQLEATVGVIRSIRSVGGGSISHAFRIETGSGPAFVKVQDGAAGGFFEAEAAGLSALASAGSSLRIPAVVGWGQVNTEAYIVMEWLEERDSGDYQSRLGRGLAEVHRAVGAGWGWPTDGFIGSLPQANSFSATWSEFWWTRRLEPQIRRLRVPAASPDEWGELEQRISVLLEPAVQDGPSLIHGDLWSGNVMSTDSGPALVDPASYQGHREVDLAMAELFGGFGNEFFSSYSEAWPLQPGYEARKGVYQLYYLLVHVNLFGVSYVPRTHHTLRRVLTQA